MKKLILSFTFSILFAVSFTAQQMPTAQQVIDNYVVALGGKQKLESIKTLSLKNSINVMGMDMEGKTIKKDNKFKSTQNFMGQESVQLFNGTSGYTIQMGQKMDFPADQLEKMKTSKVMDALAMNAAKIKSVEKTQIDGKDYYVLTSDDSKYYFDAKTNLLYKTESDKSNITIGKYTDVDGIKFVEEMKINAAGQEISVKNSDIQINKGVTDEDFK